MNCTVLKRDISVDECAEYILSRQESRELVPCRSCPVGLALMATVRQAAGAFYEPEKEESIVDTMTPHGEEKTYSQGEIARMAGVSSGNMTYALKLIRQGRTELPPNAAKIKNVMDTLGLTPADLEKGRPAAAKPVVPAHVPFEGEVFTVNEPPADTGPLWDVQACRVCGCTNDNACPGGCYWVEEDLCSACFEAESAKNEETRSVPFRVDRSDYSQDFRLGHIPLEALVLEITRRMPRAEVVLR